MGWISVRYDVYLFDFDGTVADTGEGIRRSVAYSLERLGYDVPEKAVLDRFIGPPLHDTYVALFDMTDEQAERAGQDDGDGMIPQEYDVLSVTGEMLEYRQNAVQEQDAGGNHHALDKDLFCSVHRIPSLLLISRT